MIPKDLRGWIWTGYSSDTQDESVDSPVPAGAGLEEGEVKRLIIGEEESSKRRARSVATFPDQLTGVPCRVFSFCVPVLYNTGFSLKPVESLIALSVLPGPSRDEKDSVSLPGLRRGGTLTVRNRSSPRRQLRVGSQFAC